MKRHLVIIGYVWVEPNSSAAGSRMLQLIELFLKNDFTVTFASPAQKSETAYNLTSIGVKEEIIELNSSSFDDFIQKENPLVVMFDRFMMEEQFGWRVAENCPKALRILDTEDLHFLRKTRHSLLKKDVPFTKEALLNSELAKREIAAILRCDLSLIISSFEMNLLTEVFKVDKKLLIHLPFLLERISDDIIDKWKTFSERRHFVFIGNFLHVPNVDAVLQLKQFVWSAIREKMPLAELHVYGAYPTQQILQTHKPQEGFYVKGYVPNARKVIEESRVLLAPLRFGAGIKGKLTDAMSCGTPTVTTTIGAEGMHEELPWNGYIEDVWEEFAEKAIALYTNEKIWKQSQENGVEIVNSCYRKGVLSIKFIAILEETIADLEKHRTQNFLGGLLQYKTLQATKFMSKWIEEKNKT